MVRRSTRRKTRRRMRGGFAGKLLKGLALVVAIALGTKTQPATALEVADIRRAYNWLADPIPFGQRQQDIQGVIEEASALYGKATDQAKSVLNSYMETPSTLAEVPVDLPSKPATELSVDEVYTVTKYTFPDVTDVREGEKVILKKIHPAIEDPDDPIPESYEIMKESDQTGASEGRTFLIPKTEIALSCAGETCSLPRPGGRRRKTLRRRK